VKKGEYLFNKYAIKALWLAVSLTLPLSSIQAKSSEEYYQTENKLKLLVFSGSDWCIPCIKFDRQILQDSNFKAFAKNNLTIEIADFPQHKILTKSTIVHNEELAARYNPNGYFPHVLLLDDNGNILTQIKTNKVNTDQIISQITIYLPEATKEELSASLLLMGSSFQITIVTEKAKGMALLAESINEIQNIESWLSSWKEGSITTMLNNEAFKQPQQVPDAYYQLLQRCLTLSELTQGAFDISFSGLGSLYKFDKEEHPLPNQAILHEKLLHIGSDKINLLDKQKVLFTDSLLRIGFGAIGKGYAADKVKEMMIAKGVTGGVINASGDLTAWGTRANGNIWQVGIPDPKDKENILLWLPIDNKAIATSGDYEKYFISDGIRYSHIINPKTGLPVVGASSVSIVSNSGELSDALATAVSVLGLELGMNLINQIEGVECVFIDNNRKLHFSNGLQAYAY